MPPPALLRKIGRVPRNIPVHFRIPMGRDPDILLSVRGDGSCLWSLPDEPCDRLAATPECVTSFGRGPLIFVEVDINGWYFTRPPLPAVKWATLMPNPSMQRIIELACTFLGRPSPVCNLPRSVSKSSLHDPTRLDIIADCLSSPCILTLDRSDWGIMFYIRVDLAGYYHAYPHVGGPFQTLDEVYSAVECDLKHREDPKIRTRQPEDSQVDYVVRQCLYWPDGERMKCFNVDERRDRRRLLVQALVDKYNDYAGDPDTAYELKDVVHYESVCVRDSYMLTYHINFTAKYKEPGHFEFGVELFFAEVTCDCKTGEHKFVVSCFCRVEPTDNGRCYGCNVKHPNAAVYLPGQADACYPFGASDTVRENCDEDPAAEEQWFVAEEKRLRELYKAMDEPGYMEKVRAIMNGTL